MAVVQTSNSDLMLKALHNSAIHRENNKNCDVASTAVKFKHNLQKSVDTYSKNQNVHDNLYSRQTISSANFSDYESDTGSSNSYSSSSFSGSQHSEQYVPLTCTLVKTFPQRRCTHCLQRDIENDFKSSDDQSQQSTSNSYYDYKQDQVETPIRAVVQYMDVDRQCGEIQKHKYDNFTTHPSVNQPSPAQPSLIANLNVGHVNKHIEDAHQSQQKVMLTVQGNTQQSFTAQSDKVIIDFAQIELIADIVKRLHANANDVTLEMLQNVNWGEQNYQAALQPLHRIYCQLQSRARQLQNVPTFVIEQVNRKYAKHISQLVRQLPSSQAFSAKLISLASHPIKSAKAPVNLPLNESMLVDKAHKAKVKFVNQSQDKACIRGAQRYDVLTENPDVKLVLQSKMTSCVVGSSTTKEQVIHTKRDKAKMKESVQQQSEHAIRRQRQNKRRLTNKTSFSQVPTLQQADSIVQPQCQLIGATTHALQDLKERKQSDTQPKSKRRRRRRRLSTSPNHHKHVKQLVDVAPENEGADAVIQGNTDYIGKCQSNTAQNTKTVAVASNTLGTQKSNGVAVTPNSLLIYTEKESDKDKNKSVNKANLKLTKGHASKHRRERLNKSIRSCQFAQLQIDEAGEVPDGDQSLKTDNARQATQLQVMPEAHNSKSLNRAAAQCTNGYDNIASAKKNGGIQEKKKKHRKLRNKLHRSRDISISQLEDERAGEIYQNDLDMSINDGVIPMTNKQSSISKFNDVCQNVSNYANRKNFTGPRSHSSLHSVSLTINSDINTILDEAPSSNCLEGKSINRNQNKRHRRMRVSRQVSISQIPDEIAGQIEQKDTQTLNSSDNVSSSNQQQTRNRVFPKHVIRIQRVGEVDKQVIDDDTSPHLPTLVRTAKGAANTVTNKAVTRV